VGNGLRTETTDGAQSGVADARLTKYRIICRAGANHSCIGALVLPLARGEAIILLGIPKAHQWDAFTASILVCETLSQ
jgi:hypothetical protein